MKGGFVIITNNPLVEEKLGKDQDVEYENLSFEETLKKVRDRIYLGHRLLTHPLSGSVKPNETPYKSVMVSKQAGALDLRSAEIIESAIHACGKFQFRSDKYKPEVYKDFQVVDCTLIESAIPSVEYW
ncbi:MAG: GrdX protein [Coprococcus sp.]|nr:GrdX protein [Coprococcus sp.]